MIQSAAYDVCPSIALASQKKGAGSEAWENFDQVAQEPELYVRENSQRFTRTRNQGTKRTKSSPIWSSSTTTTNVDQFNIGKICLAIPYRNQSCPQLRIRLRYLTEGSQREGLQKPKGARHEHRLIDPNIINEFIPAELIRSEVSRFCNQQRPHLF